MTKEPGTLKKSLEEIASKARAIKDSLLPAEIRIRETSVELPRTTILRRLYDELLEIQRIAILKGTESDENIFTRMQGRALFPFAAALYMPFRRIDFPFSYGDFHGGLSGYSTSSEGCSPLDLLLKADDPTRRGFTVALSEREVSAQILRDLQYFHELEADRFFKDYVGLLELIREKLGDFAEFDFKELKEREIPATVPNAHIRIFADGRSGYQEGETKIINEMMQSDDWSESLGEIQGLIDDVEDPSSGNVRRYRVLSTDHYFTPVQLPSAPERKGIIGIDHNLEKLEALVRGYGAGRSTPNIVLLGPGGVGKTMSLHYVIKATEDLKNVRYFFMDSLGDISRLVELGDGYKPVGIIDDMRGEVSPEVYERLKEQLEGLRDISFDRALIIISANPKKWDPLDDPVKQRLGGVKIKYQPDPESYEQLLRYFCNEFDVEFREEMVKKVKKRVPREVRDYVRACGSEQTGSEKMG